MSVLSEQLKAIHDAMLAAYGPQHWWPGDTPTEVIIGAILTQNTAWRNVERAIDNLKQADALDWQKLHEMEHEQLAELIRPSGYFNVKTKRLKAFTAWVIERFDGDLDAMFACSMHSLREELLSVKGIGRETADSILLYAGGMPSFVVDAYTARILYRHHLIDGEADYDEIQSLFESALPEDVPLFNEYHALIVQIGRTHCRPKARCEECPLNPFDHDAQRDDG